MAIENPSGKSELMQGEVTDMGLVVYTPAEFHTPIREEGDFGGALSGDLTYVHIERDDDAFADFLGEIVDLLSLPEAPPPPGRSKSSWSGKTTSCPYCQFLHDAKVGKLLV